LLCGLLETMKQNVNLSSFDLKIFEIGKVFFSRGKGELPCERNHASCLITGMRDDEYWHSKDIADYYDLKGCVESIFSDLRIGAVEFRAEATEPFLQPGKASGIMIGDSKIGFLGEVHRDVLAALDLKNAAYIMEIDLEEMAELFPRPVSYREISRFPSITRDAAFLVGKQIDADRILKIVHEIGEELLEKVCIFDVYDGKSIPDGMRSLGLRFIYRSPEKTLTDEEITGIHSRIVERVITITGSRIRG
ncbi:MAG: hypothetical protein L7F78_02180, partial [Syntrophales bacterium LBB04]|nr:hypothetical protein [Syntrophales bacterium LBB04]